MLKSFFAWTMQDERTVDHWGFIDSHTIKFNHTKTLKPRCYNICLSSPP